MENFADLVRWQLQKVAPHIGAVACPLYYYIQLTPTDLVICGGFFCTFAMRLWEGADYGKRYNTKNKCNNALQNYTNSATLQSWNRDKMHQSYA